MQTHFVFFKLDVNFNDILGRRRLHKWIDVATGIFSQTPTNALMRTKHQSIITAAYIQINLNHEKSVRPNATVHFKG